MPDCTYKLLTMYVVQKGNTVYLLYNVLSSMGFNHWPSQPVPRYAAVRRRAHGFAAGGEGQCALDWGFNSESTYYMKH